VAVEALRFRSAEHDIQFLSAADGGRCDGADRSNSLLGTSGVPLFVIAATSNSEHEHRSNMGQGVVTDLGKSIIATTRAEERERDKIISQIHPDREHAKELGPDLRERGV